MDISLKTVIKPKIIIAILSFAIVIGVFPISESAQAQDGMNVGQIQEPGIIQENSLTQISSPKNPDPEVVREISAVITGYSSTPEETDDTPFITAAGTPCHDGIIANNLLPFGTEVKIPEIYGDKIFTVEDRMNKKWGDNRFDIWFSSTQAAKNFGIREAYIEILGN